MKREMAMGLLGMEGMVEEREALKRRGEMPGLVKVVLTESAVLGLTINDVPKKNKKGKRVA